MEAILYSDIPRLYTALAEWLACIIYIRLIRKKHLGRRFWMAAVVGFFVLSGYLYFTVDVPIYLWIPTMMFAVVLMYIFMYLTCDAPKLVVGYYCARAFLLAELAASLEWQMECFFRHTVDHFMVGVVTIFAIYFIVFGWASHMDQEINRRMVLLEINAQEFFAAAVVVALTFALSNISFIFRNTPFSGGIRADVFYIRTLVDVAGVMILYVYQARISEMQAEKELNSINSMLKAQYEKYRGYQDSFDMINIKYHDLKHQIAGLRAEMTDKQREEWIDTLEKELEEFRPEMQTGNSVLDTLIAGKMMSCRANNIKLTCVADGKLLEFMHVTDICTIIGNALDNAIESVSVIDDPEKRLINLSVSSKKNFVLIQTNNYCEKKVKIKNGLPVSTKHDRSNHGFGLKSIKYTAEKYHGTMNVGLNKNWFELKVLVPLNKQDNSKNEVYS